MERFDGEYGQIRILHVLGGLKVGGAESRIMDLYRYMNRDKIQFDFLVHYDPSATGKKCPTSEELMAVREPDYFDNSVRALGGNIYCVPRFNGKNILEYRKALTRLFKEHGSQWKAVQGHMTSTASIYLPIAKKYGVPITIAHSRSAGTDKGIKGIATNALRQKLHRPGFTDFSFACSKEAGIAAFGQTMVDAGNVKIIPNAVDIDKFKYNPEVRNRIRRELGIENNLVIGHVGNFRYAKNHEMLLQIFSDFCRIIENDDLNEYTILHGMPLKLLMIGNGSLFDEMKSLADKLHIADRCLFLGAKTNAYEYYQAFDYFCFPSRYEGLPGSVIEAQAAGLQCLISDNITPEVDVTRLVSRMKIEESSRDWAKKIIEDLVTKSDLLMPLGDREATSKEIIEKLRNEGFDVKTQAKMMEYFYEMGTFL